VARITFATSDTFVDFDDDDEVNVLRVSIRYGCGVPFKCASGNCGTDRIFVESGRENLSPIRPKERDRLGDDVERGYRLACQTYALGDVTVSWETPEPATPLPERARERLTEKWLAAEDTE
jgi:ferredoxin